MKDYEVVAVYTFTCKKCGKSRRESIKQVKAENGLCRKCLHLSTLEATMPMFDEEVGGVSEVKGDAISITMKEGN